MLNYIVVTEIAINCYIWRKWLFLWAFVAVEQCYKAIVREGEC